MPELATIGVYGFSAEGFLRALREADVGMLLDVRQRRGVRGREYAWANSLRLQRALSQAGVTYRHLRELAPTTELRQLQYREDARRGEGKRSRTELAARYRERYTREILDHVDLEPIVTEMASGAVSALFCVERDPEACHRSIVAERMRLQFGLSLVDLRP